MKVQANVKTVCTTVGDLVVAMVDAALKAGSSERNAYRVTGLIVNTMLQPATARVRPRRIGPNLRRFS